MAINKLHDDILEGQINIFDLLSEEIIKPKETVAKCVPKENNFTEIINLYEQSCNRIVKHVSGAIIVELEDRTLYFNKQGINEFEIIRETEIDGEIKIKEVALLPSDEILIVNKDKELNDLQLKKLKDINPLKYIKRKGDANIIIPLEDKTIVINPKGWILEYIQKPKYQENELFVIKSVNEVTESENAKGESEVLQVGDKVEFNYDGPQTGNIVSIYNNGETVNVSWNNKRTAFYYKCVKKIS